MNLRTALDDFESERVLAVVKARMLGGQHPSIGRFEIEERIGAGGTGEVYRCHDSNLDRKVAVKRLHDANSTRRDRIRREAQALAKLSHPNVVQVFEVGEHRGVDFLAMEHIDGQTFEDWLKQTKPAPEEILRKFLEAGRGLAAAHEAGIVHLDFKPSNVLIGRGGRVCVVDFGLAMPVEVHPTQSDISGEDDPEGVATAKQASRIAGTPRYMSPEQLLGEELGASSDQFSFCVALFEALWGYRPVFGDRFDDRRASIGADVRVPSGRRAVFRVLRRGLARHPENRYPSMSALLDALERISRVRRRLGWGSAVAASLVAMFALAFERSPEPFEAGICEVGLAGVWDETREADIGERMKALPVSSASGIWAGVAGRVGAWGDDWTAEAKEVCSGLERAGDLQEQSMLVARATCLADQRSALGGFLVDLDEGGQRTLAAAADRVDELVRARDCSELGLGLSASPSMTRDLLSAAAMAELEAISRARFRGEYEDARTRAEALIAKVREVEPQLATELVVELGKICDELGDPACAKHQYARAFHQAEGLGLVRERAEWALERLDLELSESLDLDDANKWYELASEAVERVVEDDGRLRAHLAYARGRLAEERGDREQAKADYERARELAGEDGRDVGAYIGALADIERDGSDRLQLARLALERLQAQYGDRHPRTAKAWLRLGLVEGADRRAALAVAVSIWEQFGSGAGRVQAETLLGEFALQDGPSVEGAAGHAEAARELLESVALSDHRLRGQLLLLDARIEQRRGAPKVALAHARQARESFVRASLQPGDPGSTNAQLLVGELLLELGQVSDAGYELRKVLELSTNTRMLATGHMQLGEVELRGGQLEAADHHLRECARPDLAQGNQTTYDVLRGLVDIRLGREPSVSVAFAELPEAWLTWLDALGMTPRERALLDST